MTKIPMRFTEEALAVWPRFLLLHLAFGIVLGVLFTAALIALDAQGLGSVVLASEAPAIPIAALGLSCAALAACGSLATAMAQFDAYAGPQPALAQASRRPPAPRGPDPRA